MPDRRRPFVLLVVVLILTGTALPSTANPLPADDLERVSEPVESDTTVRNESPVERKLAAVEIVESMDVGWRLQARQRERAIDRLNGTLTDYRDPYRVSSASVFRDDRRALAALARIAWINATAAEVAADHVVAADLATVNTSIDDARLALERTGGRVDEPRDRRRAERAIERAIRARDRGLRALDEDGWRPWRTSKRGRAVAHLGVAWLHAQHALSVLDRSSDPVLTIDTRSDPPRNRSAPLVRTIRGSVADVRAYELGNVSVAVNGTSVGSTPLDSAPAPGRNASFAVNVTLDRSTVEVTVTVSEGDSSDPVSWRERREGWHRFGRHVDRSREAHGSSERFDRSRFGSGSKTDRSDTATVRFDGDGLPDMYEVGTVKTDPLDADSDASTTDANEADDGVLDGGEDFDDDGLVTYVEYEFGTDPFANDSDSDGLPDRFEASIPTLLEPTSSDTDGDGDPDGAEDFDGDGLTASDEYANDTSVARADSDGDGLDDGEEVHTHDTAPIDDDTDDDGLGDAEELRLGVDPLMADTDGDGVRDGDETYTTAKTDDLTGVRISLTGRGDVASQVSVENVSQPADSDFLAAPVVRLRNGTNFESASITIPFDANAAADPGNLSVYKWSPEDEQPWRPINSTVNLQAGTVSANVSSFSFFTVMDGPEWAAAITDTISPTWPRYESFDDVAEWAVEGDAEVRNGALVVSSSREGSFEPDLVVAKDGSGDFERIQAAVDAATEGESILVKGGVYGEEVVIGTSLQLIGRNATIDGSEVGGGGEVGVRISGGTESTLSGFTITGFERGIEGRSRDADVRLSGVVLRGNRIGLDVRGSGRWTLDGVSAVENGFRGITVIEFEGDVLVSGGEISRNGDLGIVLFSYTGAATFSGTVVSDNGGDGFVIAPTTRCSCTLRDVEIDGNDDIGLFTHSNPRQVRIEDAEVRGNEIGLYVDGENDLVLSDVELFGHEHGIHADGSSGRVELADVDVVGESSEQATGIKAIGSSADWVLGGVLITDNRRNGILGERASGDWSLDDVQLLDNGVNLRAPDASGSWVVSDVRVEGARTDGIDASGAAGRWSLTEVRTTANGRDGLRLSGSSASWQVDRSSVASNARYGIDSSGTTGPVSITRTSFHGNGEAGVHAPSASPPIEASENWWGQSSGPEPTQTVGNVLTEPHCESPECPAENESEVNGTENLERIRASPRLGASTPATVDGGEDASTARRTTTLPEGVLDITATASVRGRAASDSTARLLVRGETGEEVIADVTAGAGRFHTQSADLTRFAGETVTVLALAEGDAELSVDWIDVAIDTDGDGLRDAIERADLGMPTGPRPGASLASLDPTNPDTDGDGLPDGEELTGVAVERLSAGPVDSLSFRAKAADADPTVENSDGGGLNDSEEVAVGSDPFVLETLVLGYTIPTMTHGPNDTLEDRQPMTVGEANGLHTGVGRDSNLIAWPSRQFFDPLFCIKELTGGPGCAPKWMIGVEPKEDKLYVYVPFVVYAESDAGIGAVPYQMSFDSLSGATFVKGENVRGTVAPGRSQRGFVVYELPDKRAFEEAQPGAFRSIGHVNLQSDFSGTIFDRETDVSVTRGYSVSTSTLLPATEQMLEDTQFVLEHGMNVALAAEAGATVAIKTGSRARGSLVFLYELAKSQVDTPPKSIEDHAMSVSLKGIGSFEAQIDRSENEIYQDIFGDGVVRPVGPTVIRQN